ncbi:snare-complex protein syntaxin-18 N-terminus-domain-containing protein [Colletotrichum godetiae]|uniref:Snare-complex protein syntaxin-18 N-terminus-domain-containing protein n=1 Tax=Colletotrichum godetiae TaxID=1209918 RepID=A0AAJ0B005_9PEZI|nr:snare-complex protein syntaxin-18 N-terminus-domain-containing protein [Colletotrichum godetiae]KAK1700084.1 snare-complex protein syntaxin-18 N-terminus-domain-containing protein [Colletotrichum godetiae]
MDITPVFNEILRKRNAPIVTEKKLSLEAIDGFLKEAYRINSHITNLHNELKDVRQAYLSTAQPRKSHIHAATQQQQRHLTDHDREEVDANAKQMLRELNASITALNEAELLRRETETAVIRKKYVSRLGALGAWAAASDAGGDSDKGKTADHAAAEARARTIGQHRDEVIQSLRLGLQRCGRTQQDMMEVRLTREMEKNRSVLAKAGGGGAMPELGGFYESMAKSAAANKGTMGKAGGGLPPVDEGASSSYDPREGLTDEQIQMFEKGNQDMLQHYNSTLDKVRTAEKSLLEIAELQTLLVGNLATQSAHIEQLVADSENITADVGGGNKQLKKAAQRPSAARYTFFASAGLCTFLILWDLII